MLSQGFSTCRGRRGSLLHHDAVNGVLRSRRGSRLTALTSGGTIPDNADYQVLLEPENHLIGTVNEDFAVESLAGDIFQLGNRSYKIQRVERGVVRVEDAHGMAPTIPFWLGEAPGRTDELSQSVSRLRENIADRLERDPTGLSALRWLADELGVVSPAAEQLLEYLQAAYGALGCLPTQQKIVLERFFDEAGGMQLVIHSPYGSRINRAWGLALRKRFCRKFNFELQAAATEDNIVISLTQAHSFPLDEVVHYLHSASVRNLLTQAMLDSPMFTTRWRWVVGVALALPRFRGGRKVAPQLARMGAEDLMGAVFPDQIACAENLVGEREIPDHPLVRQAISDSLTEAMDIEGLERLLRAIESGAVAVVTRELTQPSPLSLEVLSARPYAYLDDAPLEERRTQAVMARRWMSPQDAADLGRLDPEAIARVRNEAWPEAENADELHDALVWLGFITNAESSAQPRWRDWLNELAAAGRVGRIARDGSTLWISAERANQFRALWPLVRTEPEVSVPFSRDAREWSRDEALIEIIRGRLEGLGPVTTTTLGSPLGLKPGEIAISLASLEAEGFAMRGRFTAGATEDEWCERRLLSRIHHYTIKRLRAEIEPVAARDFLRFLFVWQHLDPKTRMAGPKALDAVLLQLEGFEAPAAAWESEILPARLADYDPDWLDERCLAGYLTWMRLRPRGGAGDKKASPLRTTPIAILPRQGSAMWTSLSSEANGVRPSPRAEMVAGQIRRDGASFFHDLLGDTGLLRSQLEEAIAELVALGVLTSDSFGGLRALLTPSRERRSHPRRRRRSAISTVEDAGRWSLVRRNVKRPNSEEVEHVARALLRRYGVVFWRLIEREASRLPPWRELLRVYRRLESRGEIRGGRFVAGFSGEQFALPDAIGLLRENRRHGKIETWIAVSGSDPLNLAGILTPGPKIAALAGNRVLYRDGVPMAALVAGDVTFFEEFEPATQWQIRQALLRGAEHAPSLAPTIGAAFDQEAAPTTTEEAS
jgi:ATP-dependent Lhr-like helicase